MYTGTQTSQGAPWRQSEGPMEARFARGRRRPVARRCAQGRRDPRRLLEQGAVQDHRWRLLLVRLSVFLCRGRCRPRCCCSCPRGLLLRGRGRRGSCLCTSLLQQRRPKVVWAGCGRVEDPAQRCAPVQASGLLLPARASRLDRLVEASQRHCRVVGGTLLLEERVHQHRARQLAGVGHAAGSPQLTSIGEDIREQAGVSGHGEGGKSDAPGLRMKCAQGLAVREDETRASPALALAERRSRALGRRAPLRCASAEAALSLIPHLATLSSPQQSSAFSMSNPGHRPGVKAKSEEERIARRNASNAKAQQRAYERRKKRDERRAVLDAQLNGPSTPQVVREAQAAPLTAERLLPALERELAERTRESRKAAAELAAAHLQARIQVAQALDSKFEATIRFDALLDAKKPAS